MVSTIGRITAVAGGVCAVALGIGLVITSKSRNDAELLAAALAELPARPATARFSAIPHRPPPSIRTTAEAATSPETLYVRGLAGQILQIVNPLSHAAATAHLVIGASQRSSEILETLVRREPSNAGYWNDVAAVRYEVATTSDDPRGLAFALVAADRAIALDGSRLEARFNRGLVLEALRLHDDAIGAYEDYIGRDQASPWSTEARVRIQRLRSTSTMEGWEKSKKFLILAAEREDRVEVERIVRRFPQESRTFGEGEGLAKWSDAVLAGDETAAAKYLRTSRAIGEALALIGGDTLLREIVNAIPDPPEAFAGAYRTYRDGRLLLHRRDLSGAIPKLAEAERAFGALGNPLALVAMQFRATALADAHDTREAATLLSQLENSAGASHLSLKAQLHWLRALIATQTGRLYDSYLASLAALRAFERLGERRNAARMRASCVSLLTALGDETAAWRLRREAFAEASVSGDKALLEGTLNNTGRDALTSGHVEIARSFFNLELAHPPVSPRLRFDAVMRSAFLNSDASSKTADYAALSATALQITDQDLRADALNELKFMQAVRSHDVDLLSEVIEFQTRRASVHLLPFAYAERARLHAAAARTGAARRDLERAIDFLEASGRDIGSDALRDTFFGSTSAVYDTLAALLIKEGNAFAAFELSDRGRTRLINPRGDTSTGAMKHVDSDVVLLHYTTLPETTLITVARGGDVTPIIIPTGRRTITEARDRLLDAVAADERPRIHSEGRTLYELLIAPAEDRIRSGRMLIISTDETTAGIPFAALPTSDSRALIENYPIAFTPSASALNGFSDAALEMPLRVAVVTDPALDPILASLPRLPASRRDLPVLRRIFPTVGGLTGSEATTRRVTTLLATHDIAHIATHAYSSPRDASLSLIALAPDGDQGLWHLRDIAAANFSHLRMVVLAGCSTATYSGGSGSIRSLALAFLAAGAQSVVATSWDVDDAAASDLTAEFYRSLANGDTPASALRHTQITALRSGKPVYAWGAFQIFITGEEKENE